VFSFFEKIIDTLTIGKLHYMLSGSIAMGIYTIPRATRDFDFIIFLQEKDIPFFSAAFKEGFYCDEDAIRDAIKNKGMFNIIDYDSGYKADFVILKNTQFRQEEFKRRIKVDFWNKSVYVVTVEDLLLSKLIWIQQIQSGIQMEDIKQLLKVKNLDTVYLNNWIQELNLNTFNLL